MARHDRRSNNLQCPRGPSTGVGKVLIAVLSGLVLSACTATNPDGSSLVYRHSVLSYYNKYETAPPDGRVLTVCHGYTCEFKTPYRLTDPDLSDLDALFPADKTLTAETERARIQQAVALMERRVGEKIGTRADEARNNMLTGSGDPTQQDCVDEAANTMSYILVLHERGLIRRHTIEKPALRNPMLLSHYTAVLRDKQSGVDWAVDSWFRPNGEPPLVMPLERWYGYSYSS